MCYIETGLSITVADNFRAIKYRIWKSFWRPVTQGANRSDTHMTYVLGITLVGVNLLSLQEWVFPLIARTWFEFQLFQTFVGYKHVLCRMVHNWSRVHKRVFGGVQYHCIHHSDKFLILSILSMIVMLLPHACNFWLHHFRRRKLWLVAVTTLLQRIIFTVMSRERLGVSNFINAIVCLTACPGYQKKQINSKTQHYRSLWGAYQWPVTLPSDYVYDSRLTFLPQGVFPMMTLWYENPFCNIDLLQGNPQVFETIVVTFLT